MSDGRQRRSAPIRGKRRRFRIRQAAGVAWTSVSHHGLVGAIIIQYRLTIIRSEPQESARNATQPSCAGSWASRRIIAAPRQRAQHGVESEVRHSSQFGQLQTIAVSAQFDRWHATSPHLLCRVSALGCLNEHRNGKGRLEPPSKRNAWGYCEGVGTSVEMTATQLRVVERCEAERVLRAQVAELNIELAAGALAAYTNVSTPLLHLLTTLMSARSSFNG